MYAAIVLMPLVGALLAGFCHRTMGERTVMGLAAAIMAVASVLAWVALFGLDTGEPQVTLLRWITSGDLEVFWSIRVDRLSLVMAAVVTSVSTLVHLVAIGFTAEAEDAESIERFEGPGRARLIAFLGVLTFFLLLLVTADTLLQVFAGLEGTAAAAFLLTGFWYKRPLVDAAAIRVFVVNRVGQAAFLLGIAATFVQTGSVQLDIVAEQIAAATDGGAVGAGNPMTWIAALLVAGVAARAASILFHTWPASAAEAPAPGAALILGAAMAGAGVFTLARLAPVLDAAPSVQTVLIVVGAASAVLAALAASVQTDIRRVLSYAAASQAGLMLAGAGVGAYQAAVFHVLCHMGVIAVLVCGAGAVMRALGRERDMRRMGGLRAQMPLTHAVMVLAALAVTGFGIPATGIGLAGHLSQNVIVQTIFLAGGALHIAAFAALLVALAVTSFALWRLIFLVFHGTTRADKAHAEAAADRPVIMMFPIYGLTLLSALAGLLWAPDLVGDSSSAWWAGALPEMTVADAPAWIAFAPVCAVLIGAGAAFYLTGAGTRPGERSTANPALVSALYLDTATDTAFVRPARAAGEALWRRADGVLIDGVLRALGPGLVPWVTQLVGRLQTGFLYHYALVMLVGLAAIVTWLTIQGGL